MEASEIPLALTFDDVLLLPQESTVLPSEVETSTRLTPDLLLSVPLLSAAMDSVTESATAIVMARLGGLGIIHRNLTPEQQALEIEKVERAGRLIEAGADLLCIDTAHGHSAGVLETVRSFKKNFQLPLMAGNVATSAGVEALAKAGAGI